ncbi:MAG TPA: thiamine-phosphate kinase [Dehalococcoidia bacterium]|nr:thiamine-phosphate kinase [Dehalococcoidia bacterium]
MSEQTVGDLGEFGLITRLRAQLGGFATHVQLVLGPGDDAAVWRFGESYAVATTDTMVEGVHFLPGADPRDVGWKALAANVSDIAAMGGKPSFAFVTLCLPPATPVAWVDGLYDGMIACADETIVTFAGGDVVSSPVLTITIALVGVLDRDAGGNPLLLRRDAAQPGDAIAVWATFGGSAGGLRVLRDGGATGDDAARLVEHHARPFPEVERGNRAAKVGVRCAIDVSDGLVQDIGHICEASGCGAIVRFDNIPVDPALLTVFPEDARMLAATGGEDYKLVLVAPHAVLDKLGPLTMIGEMVEDPEHRVHVMDADGNEVRIERRGWDQLRGGA